MRYLFTVTLFIVVTLVLLTFTIKGAPGNPLYFQSELDTQVGGPFESTNSTSRYAETIALAETGRPFFDDRLARFATPDVVKFNNHLFSIFMPGVSFVALPFYLMGKIFHLPQLVTYFSTIVFAIGNMFLVSQLSRKLGASLKAALLAGFLFLFGTNALPYALTLTQHHLSVMLLLLAFLVSLGEFSFVKSALFGAVFGASLLVDIPNAFMMLPLLLFVIHQQTHLIREGQSIKIRIHSTLIGFFFGVIPMLLVLGWYNWWTSGSPTTVGQFIGRTDYGKQEILVVTNPSESAAPYKHILPFNTRNQLNGFYILLLSDERGWFYYAPIVAVGLFGLYLGYRNTKTRQKSILAISVIAIILLSYSMFGDPWGGWSFGPRYLIPASAVASVGIGIVIDQLKHKRWLVLPFLILVLLSVRINALGTLTTNAIPPRVEAENLPDPTHYNTEYNQQFIKKHGLSSLVYNVWLRPLVSAQNYFTAYYLSVTITAGISLLLALKGKNKSESQNLRP